MEYILTMTFICSIGTKTSIILEGVKNTITDAEVNTLMNVIISNDIFMSPSRGSLVEKSSASLTQREVKDFEIAEN